MKTRLSSILRSMVIGGLVLFGVAKVLILLTASPVPDPASGRTEPSLFAPAISTDWDYITLWQTWLLIVLAGTVLGCFVAWPIVAWMERRAGAAEPRPGVPDVETVRQFQARRIFGRQGR
jgi:ABC-type phosphate/phosphonate transport system permease subunit